MAGDNKFAGKAYQGTFAGGEGPIEGIHTVNEEGTKGQFGAEGMISPTASEVGSVTPKGAFTNSGDLFGLHSPSYAGPQNMVPENKGVVNPFDIG